MSGDGPPELVRDDDYDDDGNPIARVLQPPVPMVLNATAIDGALTQFLAQVLEITPYTHARKRTRREPPPQDQPSSSGSLDYDDGASSSSSSTPYVPQAIRLVDTHVRPPLHPTVGRLANGTLTNLQQAQWNAMPQNQANRLVHRNLALHHNRMDRENRALMRPHYQALRSHMPGYVVMVDYHGPHLNDWTIMQANYARTLLRSRGQDPTDHLPFDPDSDTVDVAHPSLTALPGWAQLNPAPQPVSDQPSSSGSLDYDQANAYQSQSQSESASSATPDSEAAHVARPLPSAEEALAAIQQAILALPRADRPLVRALHYVEALWEPDGRSGRPRVHGYRVHIYDRSYALRDTMDIIVGDLDQYLAIARGLANVLVYMGLPGAPDTHLLQGPI
jgi:hypothetical protein